MREADYLLRYRPEAPRRSGLVEASLTVSKADQHATSETIVLREDGELREFTLSETQLEECRLESMPPSVFEPEPALSTDRRGTWPPAPRLRRPILAAVRVGSRAPLARANSIGSSSTRRTGCIDRILARAERAA